MTVLCLTAHVADGLVEQDGDTLGLLVGGRAVDGDDVLRQYFLAEHSGHAVDAHEPLLYPGVGFAAGRQAKLTHAF